MPIQLRRRLTPEQRARIETNLKDRVGKKSVLTGVSKRLFTGEDVEKHLDPMFSKFSTQLTTQQQKDITAKAEQIKQSIDAYITNALGTLQREIDRILAKAIGSIRQPQDGHTPTEEELKAIFTPMINGFFTKPKDQTATTTPSFSFPDNFEKIIEEGVKKYTPNRNSGGGGVHNFYELSDVTKKTEKYGVPYKGFENKYVKVSPDGKKLIFDNASGGGGFTELTATGDANGTNVTYTFTQLPSYIVADGVWYKPTAKNGTVFWTNVGLTVTMVNPPAYDIFGVA